MRNVAMKFVGHIREQLLSAKSSLKAHKGIIHTPTRYRIVRFFEAPVERAFKNAGKALGSLPANFERKIGQIQSRVNGFRNLGWKTSAQIGKLSHSKNPFFTPEDLDTESDAGVEFEHVGRTP